MSTDQTAEIKRLTGRLTESERNLASSQAQLYKSQKKLRAANSSVSQYPKGLGRTALVKLNRSLLTTDAPSKTAKKSRPRTGRAEREFNRYLRQVAHHVGQIVDGFEAGNAEVLPALLQMLKAYSDALAPWARSTALRMLGEVNLRDIESWRSLSGMIGKQLKHDIRNTELGDVMRALLHEQVDLIKSLPLEAGERVHKLTLRGLEDSTRASEFVAAIKRSGDITKSRATLIARTEVARTASILTQARATAAGITHYRWQTSEDADVREGHRDMQGQICEFADPPAVNENGRIMYHHPGQIWNCRCWAEPLVELE